MSRNSDGSQMISLILSINSLHNSSNPLKLDLYTLIPSMSTHTFLVFNTLYCKYPFIFLLQMSKHRVQLWKHTLYPITFYYDGNSRSLFADYTLHFIFQNTKAITLKT
jgi:hypothetical protein